MPTSTCAGKASTYVNPASRIGARAGHGIAGAAACGALSRSGMRFAASAQLWSLSHGMPLRASLQARAGWHGRTQASCVPTMSGWNVGRRAAQSVCTMRLRVPHMKSDEIAYISAGARTFCCKRKGSMLTRAGKAIPYRSHHLQQIHELRPSLLSCNPSRPLALARPDSPLHPSQ